MTLAGIVRVQILIALSAVAPPGTSNRREGGNWATVNATAPSSVTRTGAIISQRSFAQHLGPRQPGSGQAAPNLVRPNDAAAAAAYWGAERQNALNLCSRLGRGSRHDNFNPEVAHLMRSDRFPGAHAHSGCSADASLSPNPLRLRAFDGQEIFSTLMEIGRAHV